LVVEVERVQLWCANSLPFSSIITIITIDKPNTEEEGKKPVTSLLLLSLFILNFLASSVMSLLRLQPINGISQLSVGTSFPQKKRPLLFRPQAVPSRTQVPNLQCVMPRSAFFVASPNNTYSVKLLHCLQIMDSCIS